MSKSKQVCVCVCVLRALWFSFLRMIHFGSTTLAKWQKEGERTQPSGQHTCGRKENFRCACLFGSLMPGSTSQWPCVRCASFRLVRRKIHIQSNNSNKKCRLKNLFCAMMGLATGKTCTRAYACARILVRRKPFHP